MPLLTYAQMATALTRAQCRTALINALNDLGFSSTSWQSGSVQRSFLEIGALVYEAMSNVVASMVTFCFNSTSSGTALTMFSESHYDNTRIAAVAAQHTERLTCSATEGPYSISIGDLVFSDGTYTFRNITGGTLASGSTLDLTIEAEVAGTTGNAAVGTITTLNTPLAGVTCTNPDLGAGVSTTTTGVDAETDAALKARNPTKWATLSIETPEAGYRYIAQTAVANCRVKINDNNPGGAGTVYVYIAADDGVASGPDVSAVQAALEARIMGARSMGSSLITTYAAAATTVNFQFVVYYDSSYNAADVEADVQAALTAYVNGAPVGGYDYSPGPSSVLLYNDIVSAIEGVDGVQTVVMTTPSANVTIPTYGVGVVGSFTDTYTAV